MLKIFDMSTGNLEGGVEQESTAVNTAVRTPSPREELALQLAVHQPEPQAVPLWQHGHPSAPEETAAPVLH